MFTTHVVLPGVAAVMLLSPPAAASQSGLTHPGTVTGSFAATVLPAPGAPAGRVADPPVSAGGAADLTGLWLDDSDGGAIYRVRQVGTRFYWIVDGTSKGSYVNLAVGDISGSTINAKWVDLPGSPMLGGGDLVLRIESNDRLVRVSSSATYGAQAWTRQGTTTPPPGRGNPPAIASGRYISVRLNGQQAIIDWAGAPTSAGSWVSIVPAGMGDGTNAGRWVYTQDKAAGSFENGPLAQGAYEARFYADAGYTQLVDRVRFEVGIAAMWRVDGGQGQILRVQVDTRPFAIVTWSNAPTTDGVWVSVVPVGTAETTHVGKWTYTNRAATGQYEAGPLTAGEYEARVYGDSGYTRIIERVRFRVN